MSAPVTEEDGRSVCSERDVSPWLCTDFYSAIGATEAASSQPQTEVNPWVNQSIKHNETRRADVGPAVYCTEIYDHPAASPTLFRNSDPLSSSSRSDMNVTTSMEASDVIVLLAREKIEWLSTSRLKVRRRAIRRDWNVGYALDHSWRQNRY